MRSHHPSAFRYSLWLALCVLSSACSDPDGPAQGGGSDAAGSDDGGGTVRPLPDADGDTGAPADAFDANDVDALDDAVVPDDAEDLSETGDSALDETGLSDSVDPVDTSSGNDADAVPSDADFDAFDGADTNLDSSDGDATSDVASDTLDDAEAGVDVAADVAAAACGNRVCELGEDCTSCSSDCGTCADECGDSVCSPSETCGGCTDDCGECATVLTFGADFSETFQGPLVAGETVTVRYDFARLPECRSFAAGLPAWSIQIFYTFDLSSPATALTPWERVGSTIEPRDVSFTIPSDATQVWMWAQNTDSSGCNRFDSNFAANYLFPVFTSATVSTPPAFIGSFQFIRSNRGDIARLGDVNPAYYFSSMRESGQQSWVQFEVYSAGITDRDYQNADVQAAVANAAIAARVQTDAWDGGPPGKPQRALPLSFVGRVGNNFVYRWFPADQLVPSVELGGLADGAYNYSFLVGTARQEVPASFGRIDGNDRVFVLSRTLNCALFPFNPPSTDGCP